MNTQEITVFGEGIADAIVRDILNNEGYTKGEVCTHGTLRGKTVRLTAAYSLSINFKELALDWNVYVTRGESLDREDEVAEAAQQSLVERINPGRVHFDKRVKRILEDL